MQTPVDISSLSFPNSVIINPSKTAKHSVIWMHGLGADANDFVSILPLLHLDDLDIRFIFPNAPIRPISINGGMPMPGWYDISDLALRNKDKAGIEHSANYIESLIQSEVDSGILSKNIILAGFSQGGAMAIHTALQSKYQLGGVMALSCYLLHPPSSQLNSNQNTSFFMAHGKQDGVVSYELAHKSYQILSDFDYSVLFKTYQMEHQVCTEEIDDISQWIRQTLS